ncbi:MAG: energy transducer TonB [Vulcanimicrobiaceae bacterium]
METVAGSIALNEASDAERERYRRHLAGCMRCVDAYGGEREIERVMATIARARDEETWAPDPVSVGRAREAGRRRAVTIGFSAIAAALAISLGLHAFLAAGLGHLAPSPANPIEIAYDGQRVTIEHRPRAVAAIPHSTSGMVVERTVVHLTPPAPETAHVQPVRVPAPPTDARKSQRAAVVAVKAWELRHPVQTGADTSGVLAQSAPPLVNHAESIAVAPEVHDVVPVGGEGSIVPRPAPIAYAEGAEGTTAYAVDVDERGIAVRCSIDKSSGYLALDKAVCEAAMKAQYVPRTVGGRAVASTYRDAVTFRTETPGN